MRLSNSDALMMAENAVEAAISASGFLRGPWEGLDEDLKGDAIYAAAGACQRYIRHLHEEECVKSTFGTPFETEEVGHG
jgi:hypothetical protein